MSNSVKLVCRERCSVMGNVYLPGEVEVDAERAELLLRTRPQTFERAGGGSEDTAPTGRVGTVPDEDVPAPEKRRRKPARVKRKG